MKAAGVALAGFLWAATAIAAPQPPPGILVLEPVPAPGFSLSSLNGDTFKLEGRDGGTGQWLFVHFWASWCGPCRKEMPAIERMAQAVAQWPLTVVIINTAEDEDTVFTFLAAHTPELDSLLDRDGEVTEQWKPRGLPATYLVDPQGQVRYQALGGRPWDEPLYLQFLRQLTGAGGS